MKNYNNESFLYRRFSPFITSNRYNKINVTGTELRVKSMEYNDGYYAWYVVNFNEIGEEYFSWEE